MTRALIFLAAGVALGLFLAPVKGSKLRELLFPKCDTANDTKDLFSDAASNAEAKGRHIAGAENRLEKMA